MTAKVRLQADRAELASFIDATFRYADDGTDAVLRTFAEGSNEVLGTERVPLNGAGLDPIIEHAVHQATKAANAPPPAVFAPPVATFIGSRARERDLGNGLVLTVEADQGPAIARCKEPSRTASEHALLKRARALACTFVGADATAITPAHPLRLAWQLASKA